MNKLLTDRTLLRKYNEIQEREKELLARLRQLEALTAGQGGQPAQSNFMDNRFTEMSAALSASQWLEKAYALWSHGRFAEPLAAIDNLNRAIALDDQNPRAFNSRAVAYLDLARYREAEEDLRKALELKPDYADAHNNLGTLHYRLRNFREAVASYSHAIDFKADFSEALLNRGLAYGKMLLFEQAVRDFQRAMQLTPNFKKSNDAGALAELNDIGVLCARARTACGLNLCRSLNFLRERGFCLEENIQSNLNP
jgi:Tfp pilus assembly protein PilF